MSTANDHDHVDAPIEYRAPTKVSDMDLSERSAKTKLLKRTPSQHGGALKVVIVGGVAGGASAAARMRRLNEQAEIILLQSGPDVSFASCGMPYYLGGEITDRPGMAVQTPQSLKEKLNLDVRVNTHVSAIDTTAKTVTCNGLDQQQYTLEYDELVLAVGAEPFKPPIPGIDRPGLFSLRNLQDMDDIYEWMNQQKSKRDNAGDLHYVVAGAGYVGLEMVEQFHALGVNVTLVDVLPQILGPMDVEMAAIIHRELEAKGVEVILGDGIKEFAPDPKDPSSTILTLQSGRVLPSAQLTLLGLGVRPDTKVAKEAGIDLGPRGHIAVDDYLRTSAPHVWAVGDAVQVSNPIDESTWAVPLAGPANRQGRMAVDNIMAEIKGEPMRKYKGTYGSSVVRVFRLTGATVGMNEKQLQAKPVKYEAVHVHPGSHAGYYPGAKPVHLKVLFDPTNGKLYGAQAVGEDGVEKRIDVIATALQAGMTIQDLAELELCYAPPVGSAKDPVNMAGFVGQNIIEGVVSQVQWHQLEELSRDPDTVIVDVRNPGEITNTGKLVENAINIPLPELRDRLSELMPFQNKHVVVSCASGQRSYYAYRILKQNGFDNVDNLSGAFLTYSVMKK